MERQARRTNFNHTQESVTESMENGLNGGRIMRKPLPAGVDNFADIIKEGYYYVDKTMFIKELMELKGKVNLFTRPRRFGKTLNLSMLRYFFIKHR